MNRFERVENQFRQSARVQPNESNRILIKFVKIPLSPDNHKPVAKWVDAGTGWLPLNGDTRAIAGGVDVTGESIVNDYNHNYRL